MKNNLTGTFLLSAIVIGSLSSTALAEGFTKGKLKIPFNADVKMQSQNVTEKTNLVVKFNIDSGSYIYKDSIMIDVKPVNGIKISKPLFPKAEKKLDKFSNKEREIYHNSFSINVPVELTNKYNSNKISFSSVIGYQGCSKTLCYLPMEKSFTTTANVKKK